MFILVGIAAAEGTWLWFSAHRNPRGFLRYEGFLNAHAGVVGWLLAFAVFGLFTGYAATQFPSVDEHLVSFSALKVLALAVAITAGFCEETIFRKFLMDALIRQPVGVQVLASGLAFGAAHGVWGLFRGSIAAAVGATIATAILGAALAVVYVASHRVLAQWSRRIF